MALNCSPPHSKDIGDWEPEHDPDPDRIYEQEIEQLYEEELEE